MVKKLIDEREIEIFEFVIEVTCSPKRVEYLAKDKKEAVELFLENNEDLDEYDIEVKDGKNVI